MQTTLPSPCEVKPIISPILQMGKRNSERQSDAPKVTHLMINIMEPETLSVSPVFFSSFSLGDVKSFSP